MMVKDNKNIPTCYKLERIEKDLFWVLKPYRAAKIYDKEIYEYNKL